MNTTQRVEILCPHCSKPFAAPLLGDGRHSGFKCTHCKLFVPAERATEVSA